MFPPAEPSHPLMGYRLTFVAGFKIFPDSSNSMFSCTLMISSFYNHDVPRPEHHAELPLNGVIPSGVPISIRSHHRGKPY